MKKTLAISTSLLTLAIALNTMMIKDVNKKIEEINRKADATALAVMSKDGVLKSGESKVRHYTVTKLKDDTIEGVPFADEKNSGNVSIYLKKGELNSDVKIGDNVEVFFEKEDEILYARKMK